MPAETMYRLGWPCWAWARPAEPKLRARAKAAIKVTLLNEPVMYLMNVMAGPVVISLLSLVSVLLGLAGLHLLIGAGGPNVTRKQPKPKEMSLAGRGTA